VAPAGLGPLQNQLNVMQQNQEEMLAQLQWHRRQMRLNHHQVVTQLDDMQQQMINADRRIICVIIILNHS
jgi:hypothetical protein